MLKTWRVRIILIAVVLAVGPLGSQATQARPAERVATAVTVGATAPAGAATAACAPPSGVDQVLVPRGTVDRMPSDGVLTSFSHRGGATATAGNTLRPLVLRLGVDDYQVVGRALPVLPVPGTLTTYAVRIPVRAGDLLAMHVKGSVGVAACSYGTTAQGTFDDILIDPDTHSVIPSPSGGEPQQGRLNISAVLEPDADGDGYGDVSQDGCALDAALQGPCPVPDTKVTKAPPKKTSAHKVKVKFAATLPDVTFLCTVDFKAAQPCTSPFKVKVGLGKHRLVIQATSPEYATTDTTPAEVRWKVRPKAD